MSGLHQSPLVTRRMIDGPVLALGIALALVGWCVGHCTTYHALGISMVAHDGAHHHLMPDGTHWYMWNVWKYGLLASAAAIVLVLCIAVRHSHEFARAVRPQHPAHRNVPWIVAMGFPSALWCIVEVAERVPQHQGLPPVGMLIFGTVLQMWIGAACLVLLRVLMRAISSVATWLCCSVRRRVVDLIVSQILFGTRRMCRSGVPVLATPRGPPVR